MNTSELLEKFCKNINHAQEVQRLALLIFDEINAQVKNLSKKEKLYLGNAALLHDIGYHIHTGHHNKNSQKLILEYGLDEFNEKEKEIISCICRYHKGCLPNKKEHEIYCQLDKKERKMVKCLGGILKIADSLDKNHMKLIKNIKINYDEENNITEMILTPNNINYYPEINYSKRDLFEKAFKTQVVFKFLKNN